MCMLGMGRYVHVYVEYGEVCTCGHSWLSSFMHVTFYTIVGQLVISYI